MKRKKREMTLEEVARALGHLYLLDPRVAELDAQTLAAMMRNHDEEVGGYSFDSFTNEDKAAYNEFLERYPYKEDLDSLFIEFRYENDREKKKDKNHIVELSDEEIERTFPPAPSCEEEILEKECIARINTLIDTILPADQASRLKRYFYEKMTELEIADEDGVSKQAVSQSIRAAIKRLRKALRREGYHVPNI